MKTNWAKWFRLGLLLIAGIGAGGGLVGCADEYAAYPAYRGGYYASYRAPYPYYGYGYPYRAYGPYYGGPYYGSPYYGRPYYGGSVAISSSRTYGYRDRYGRWHNARNRTRTQSATRAPRTTTRNARTRSTTVPRYQSDDENRYYNPR